MLHRAGQCAGEVFTEELDRDGLTPRQFAVLRTIFEDEGLSQTDLVTRTGIDRSTLADIIRRTVEKGLVRRRRTKADARVYAVRLTKAGREAVRAGKPAAARADRRVLDALPPAKREAFLDSLDALVRGVSRSGN